MNDGAPASFHKRAKPGWLPLRTVSQDRAGTPRISFQALVTMLFMGVVLSVGLGLVYLSFDRAKAISLSAATAYIDRVAGQTADRVDGQFQDALNALEVLKQLPSVQSGTLNDNPRLYAMIAALLRTHRPLYSLYVGYDDGQFIEMDLLDRGGADRRARLGAPPQAEFRLVVIYTSDNGARVRTTSFLSSDLHVLKMDRQSADYDPRERPWYRDAFTPSAGTVTDPYIFGDNASIGYTVRAPVPAGAKGVVAGDILLPQTDEFLKAQQLGVAGRVFLFDDDGRVIAHPRMAGLLKAPAHHGEALSLPLLREAETAAVGEAIVKWRQGGRAQQIFTEIGDRTYVAAFRAMLTSGEAGLMLAVMAPLDEFFSEIEEERRELAIFTLALVAATLPLVLWLSWLLARSVRSLAAETDRIRRFDLAVPSRQVHSFVREIDDLSRSVETMGAVVQAFARYVPKRLVQQLVETGAAMSLGGSRRQVSILFTDIADFTGITENADPELVALYTSRYLARLTEVIMTHGGTVDKFVGDSVMAIWNAPMDDADHVHHACAAVLACREANRTLNEAFEREGWPPYRTRFGLHTGEAVVGNIGSADRMNYTVLGAAVNLAARLEMLNKAYGTEILVSETVVSIVEGQFSFRFVDTVRPKGFEASVRVFELIGSTQQHTSVSGRGLS